MKHLFAAKTTDLEKDADTFLTTSLTLYMKILQNFFFLRNITFFCDNIFEQKNTLKIKDLFEKLQTLRKTHMPLLTTIFDSLNENFPKQSFQDTS